MRNPTRAKNLRLRFLPYYAAGILVLIQVRPSGFFLATGVCAIAAGALLRGWGAGHLVKNDLLTISGPYCWLRHPLYAGTLLIGIGFAAMAGGWVLLALLALGLPWFFLDYFPRKDGIECDRLERLYGGAFRSYRENVPALLPRSSRWLPDTGFEGVADAKARWNLQRYLDNNELGTALALLAGLALIAVRIVMSA